jgi:hypothetical protein
MAAFVHSDTMLLNSSMPVALIFKLHGDKSFNPTPMPGSETSLGRSEPLGTPGVRVEDVWGPDYTVVAVTVTLTGTEGMFTIKASDTPRVSAPFPSEELTWRWLVSPLRPGPEPGSWHLIPRVELGWKNGTTGEVSDLRVWSNFYAIKVVEPTAVVQPEATPTVRPTSKAASGPFGLPPFEFDALVKTVGGLVVAVAGVLGIVKTWRVLTADDSSPPDAAADTSDSD